jgi:nitric oxide reductase subunit C
MGPDLTNVISAKGDAYARAFISSGTVRMPDFDLSDAEVDSLVDFLEFVDGSGRYPAEHPEIYWSGAYVEAES